MKRWFPLILLVLIVVPGVLVLQRAPRKPATGFQAPDFTLADLNGQMHRLSDLRGKVVFLNLWATWCPPCRLEMPSMEALHKRLAGLDFVMLAVSEDEAGASVVRPFVADLGLTFPVLLDPDGRLGPRYGVTGYPETFVVDRSGNVVHHHIGPAEWDSPESVDYFLGLLRTEAQTGATPAP